MWRKATLAMAICLVCGLCTWHVKKAALKKREKKKATHEREKREKFVTNTQKKKFMRSPEKIENREERKKYGMACCGNPALACSYGSLVAKKKKAPAWHV
ncbi:hypothetical protein ACT7DF_10765 [Bacillus cereus]